ncbi:hypothetical protein V8G54_022244, partial [Vigna mungo]
MVSSLQTLNRMFIINAGSGFRMCNTVKSFLDPKATVKNNVLGNKFDTKLLEIIDARTDERLLKRKIFLHVDLCLRRCASAAKFITFVSIIETYDIWKGAGNRSFEEKAAVLNVALTVKYILLKSGIKDKLDDSDQKTPGWKFHFWEMKGIPLGIEIGPRDVASGSVVISRRDIPGKQRKVFGISMEPSNLEAYVKDKLDSSLSERAIALRD